MPTGGGGLMVGTPLTWAICCLSEGSLLAAAPAQVEHTPVALGTGKLVR